MAKKTKKPAVKKTAKVAPAPKDKTIELSSLIPNAKNPRAMKEPAFQKLVDSIETFPKMMALRPIIIDEKNIIIGGNMRYRALMAKGYKTIPAEWVKSVANLTEREKKEFIIKDNISFGEWDFDMLANEWEINELVNWGMEERLFNMNAPGFEFGDGEGTEGGDMPTPDSDTKMVQLYFNTKQAAKFMGQIAKLKDLYGTENVTDTVAKITDDAYNQIAQATHG